MEKQRVRGIMEGVHLDYSGITVYIQSVEKDQPLPLRRYTNGIPFRRYGS
ncbi:small, acid-soluble spore protein H [Oceanobacillus picturae]|uniref:Small, acid-soluble spore protein H n=1 Tax=Oceanobacillus picturae TaxID=171693 RepID=A0A0U9HYH0_9BACI|nr:hypothetical protein [Oceanobacillus picturae]GAQ16973.1 small, acid-soluble spore protein H [Oceanobacillus picturae]